MVFATITSISANNIDNINHIGNIGYDMERYYRLNIVLDTSKPYTILLKNIGMG